MFKTVSRNFTTITMGKTAVFMAMGLDGKYFASQVTLMRTLN